MFRRISGKSTWMLLMLFVFVLSACAGQATGEVTLTATEAVIQQPSAVPEEPTATSPEATATAEATTAALIEQPTAETGSEVSFAGDILPILEANCLKCHGGEKTAEGFDVNNYETVMAGSEDGAVVVPGDPEGSKLLTLVNAGKMPKKASKLPDDQIQLIHDWIAAGALDN